MGYPNPFDLKHHRCRSGGDLVEEFLATYSKRGTRRSYRSDLQQFFGEEGDVRQEVPLVQKEDITAFLKQRVEDSLKRTSLTRQLEAIRSFFRWTARQNMIDELPISEEVDTGDLIDQIFEEARDTTEGEGEGPTAEEPDGKDEGDSGGSRMGPVPMELEPGSELNLDDVDLDEVNPGSETDSGPENSSGKRPEEGAGTEPTSGSEDTESSSSEASSSEKPRSGESSGDRSTGSDPDEEGPSKEESVEQREAGEDPVGEGATNENSADEDSTGEDSGGEDRLSLPDWAVPSGDAQEIDLDRGEHLALADLPDALCGALPQLRDPSGPDGLFIRCTSDLKVQVQSNLGENSQIVEASIEHYALQCILRNGGDLSEESGLRQAIPYLHDLGWTLPRRVYDLVGALPNPDDAEGPFSEERPRWCQEGTGDGLGDAFLAAQITGVLAKGFGIGKDEQVFVGI
jgi:hypothetical protein